MSLDLSDEPEDIDPEVLPAPEPEDIDPEVEPEPAAPDFISVEDEAAPEPVAGDVAELPVVGLAAGDDDF